MWQYTNTNELCHYGTKGMKWGKRKSRLLTDYTTGDGKHHYQVNDPHLKRRIIGQTGYQTNPLYLNNSDRPIQKKPTTRKKNTATRTAVIRIIGTNANAQYEKGKREYYRKKSKKVVSKVAGQMVKRRAR